MNFLNHDLQLFSSFQSNGIEMRGAWHMPHFLNDFGYDERTLAGVQKLLDRVKKIGFNTIFIETVNAFTIYKSNCSTVNPRFDFPKSQYGEYEDDYLACFIGEAHKRDLKVHAWTTTMRAGKFVNSLAESLPGTIKPEWLARGYHNEFGLNGKYGELMWLDASNPEVSDYLVRQYQELTAKYDLDGIELDAIRYPVSNLMEVNDSSLVSDFGYTDCALTMFNNNYHYHGDLKTEIVQNQDLKAKWVRFRSHLMTEIVEKIRTAVLEIKPDLPFSAAVFVNSESSIKTVCQDWSKWVKNGWFDFISPMAYSTDLELVKSSFLETENITNNTCFNLLGIASIIIEGGNYKHHFDQIKVINDLSGLGSILFSLRQLLKDEKTSEMLQSIYHSHPAISPLATIPELISFMLPLIKTEIPNFKDDYLNLEELISTLYSYPQTHRYIKALTKTIAIKQHRSRF